MGAIVILIMFFLPMLILLFAIRNKSKQWKASIGIFNRNKKAIETIDVSDFKLGSGHVYDDK